MGWVGCGERRGGVTGDMIFCRHVCLGQGFLHLNKAGGYIVRVRDGGGG